MANLFGRMMSSCPAGFIRGIPSSVGVGMGVGAAFGGMRGSNGDRRMGGRIRGAFGGAAVGALGAGAAMGYNALGGSSGIRTLAGNLRRNPGPMMNAVKRAGMAKGGMIRNMIRGIM